MENASKALIIAGAILLSILIISLGIMIFNQASGVVNNNAMSEVEISSFNQKFMQYEGTNVKGSQVNALLNQVVQNNVAMQEDKSKVVTVINGTGTTGTQTLITSGTNANWQGTAPNPGSGTLAYYSSPLGKALTGKTYEVVCSTNQKTGLVDKIKIGAK